MIIETMKIADLLADPANARKHDKKNLDAIKGSLKKFGQQKPIVVDAKGIVVAGNGTLAAAKALKWREIAVVRTGLEGVDATAYALADNRSGELASWDDDVLSKTLQALREAEFPIAEIGFDGWDVKEEPVIEEADNDVPDVEQNKHGVKPLDVWALGRHRLVCGDSTKEDQVALLMGDRLADILFTDPPYNVGLGMDESPEQAKARNRRTDGLVVKNDKMDNDDFIEFLTSAFSRAEKHMKPGAAFYIAHADSFGFHFRYALKLAGLTVRQCCIWVKDALVMGRQDYQWQHEPILYGWKDGATHTWKSDRKQTTLWNFKRPTRSAMHPTMKPVELVAYGIGNSSSQDALVLDLFLGSGTTLIAAERGGRTCYGMELDPHYCSVIIERYQQLTGDKATLLTEAEPT